MSKPGKQTRAQAQRSKRIAMNKNAARVLPGPVSQTLSGAARIAGATAGTVTLASALTATPAHALPQNGTVVGGSVSMAQTGSTLNINQGTNSAIINWQGYNIGAGETVQYLQPGSSSIILNRVTGADPSAIYGNISANGQVWVINPHGLVVGEGARVETAGFLGSTLNISNEDFSAGNFRFTGASSSLASIINRGNIKAADGGYVVLAAPSVTNSGVISATLGKVHLASGEQLTLGFQGNDLIDLVITEQAASGALGVKNTGTITADGGTVVMSAKVAADLLQDVVNNEGIIRATSIVEKDGAIILDGGEHGMVANSGTLDASGREAGEKGGAIKVLGDQVALSSTALLDVSGDAGGGTMLVGGNFHGAGAERNSSATTVAQGAELKADAVSDGDGGKVAVWSDGTTEFHGHISARGGGGGGNGGVAEVSGKTHLALTGFADLRAPKGAAGLLEIDPGSVSIVDGTADPSAGNDTITDGWISTQLEGGDLQISTAESTEGVSESITLNANVDINWSSSNTLTFSAGKDITMGGAVTAAAGTLDLKFDTSGTGGTLTFGSANVDVGTVNIFGSGTNSTIVGHETGNIFTVTGADSGQINSKYGFNNVANLTGGDGDDSFVIKNAGSLSGTASGGLGYNTLDLSAKDVVTVNLALGTATDIWHLQDMKMFIGNGVKSTLMGPNDSLTWIMNGLDSGTAKTGWPEVVVMDFQGFGNLVGGTGNDVFTINVGGLSGNLDGGLGTDDQINMNGSRITTFNLENRTVTGVAGTFTGIEHLTGNDLNTTLIGRNTGEVFDVGGANIGYVGDIYFFGIPFLIGGTGADTFIINSWVHGNVVGGGFAGDGVIDTVDVSNRNSAVTWNQQTGQSTVIFGTVSGIERLIGNGANTTIIGADAGQTFAVTGANAGMAGDLIFTGVGNLTGGSGTDTFTFHNGGSLSGNLIGGGFAADGVTDTLNLSAKASSITFDQRTSKATSIGGTFDGIEMVVGNGANSTIIGADSGQNFEVVDDDTGMAGTLSFTGVGNLTGGSGADSFIIREGGSLTGRVDGGGVAGDNVVDYLDLTAKSSVTLDRERSTVVDIIGSFSGIEHAAGNETDSTIVGRNSGETFTVTSRNAGTVDSGADTMDFTGFNNLIGGSGADSFVIQDGASLAGSVAGGGSAGDGMEDSLDLHALNTDIIIDQGTRKATGLDGTYDGIEAVVGNGVRSTIVGAEPGQSFEVTGADTGSAGELRFTDVGNLRGGSGADTFSLHDAGSLSGNVIGGGTAGDGVDDSLDLSAKSVQISFNQGTNKATDIGGTFSGIESVVGNGANSTMIGGDPGQTFRVTGADTGMADDLKFRDVGNLTGGFGADSFILEDAASLSGSVAGGGLIGDVVDDVLDLSAKTKALTFNQGTSKATDIGGTFSDIESVIGNGGGSTIIGSDHNQIFRITGVDSGTAGYLKFSQVGNLTGGTGADFFILENAGSLSGSVAGGGAIGDGVDDLLDLSAKTKALTFNQGTSKATDIGGKFNSIESVIGNGIDSTIISSDLNQTFTVTGIDTGTVGYLKFSDVGNLTGGSGDDFFIIRNGGGLSGNVTGGQGKDTLDLSAKAEVMINQQEHSATGVGGTYSSIERAVGNGANSTIIGHDRGEIFIVTGIDSGTADADAPDADGGEPKPDMLEFSGFGNLRGGKLDDYFYIKADGRLTGNLDGGLAVDHLYLSQKTGPIVLNLEQHTVTGVDKTFTGIESVAGNGVNSTIIGHNLGDTFSITGADSGTVVSQNSGTLDFQAFGNLVGGTGNDSFVGSSGSSLSGSIADNGGRTALAGTLATGSTQSYAGAATLASGTTLRAQRVTLNGLAGNGYDLTIDGPAIFNGADVVGIKNIHVTRTSDVNVARISGSGSQRYDGLVTLGADATLGGSDVTVNAVAGGNHDLTLISSGAGGITINGAVGTAGAVELVAFAGAITETGAGAISAASLSTASAGGQTLEGANSVASFDASNSGPAPINFRNSSENLTVASISNGAGSTDIANSGSITLTEGINTAGDVALTAGNGGISVTGEINTAENVALTAGTGDIYLAGNIDARDINVNAAGGSISVGGLMDSSGKVALEAGDGITVPGKITSAGNVDLTAANGGISVTGEINTADNVALTAGSGNIFLAGKLDAGNANITAEEGNILVEGEIRSSGTVAFNAGHNVSLDGNIGSGGNVVLEAGNDIVVGGSIDTISDAQLDAGGIISQSGRGSRITADLLTTNSKGGQTLSGANSVRRFNATNDGGDVLFNNTSPTFEIAGINQLGGGDIEVTNSGKITVVGSVKGKDEIHLDAANSGIELRGNVETDKDVKLLADGVITESGGYVKAAALTTESKGGQHLDEMNDVTSFSATNSGGDISFTNGPDLNLGKITQEGGDITVTNSGNVRIMDEVRLTNTAAPTTVAITSQSGDIQGAGGSLTADNLNLTGRVIGAEHGAPITIDASSVTTNTTQEIDGVSASFIGSAYYFTVHDLAPSVVLLNGVVVGGQLSKNFNGAVQLGGLNAAMAVNAQEMQEMLMLANFQEFFAQAPNVHSLDADDTAFTPVQQIIPGFLSDGRPCQLIDSKIK